MTTSTPKFLETGEEVEVLSSFDGGFVVRIAYEDLGIEHADMREDPMIVPMVYDRAPTMKRDQMIVTLDQQIKEKREQIESMNQEISDAQKRLKDVAEQHKAFIRSAKEDQALQRLWQFINGKLTHVVIRSSYDTVILPKEKCCASSGYHGELKILSLWGRSEGDLSWKLHDYDNVGMGASNQVYPVKSFEDGVEVATEFIIKLIECDSTMDGLTKHIARADEYGIKIDDKYREKLKSMKRNHFSDKRDAAEKVLKKAEQELAAFE